MAETITSELVTPVEIVPPAVTKPAALIDPWMMISGQITPVRSVTVAKLNPIAVAYPAWSRVAAGSAPKRTLTECISPNRTDETIAARGALRAAIVSSVLFGLMHSVNVLFGADPAATLLQAGYATAMGFSFATVTLRTGVIWPLIIIHGSINAAGFVTAGGTISTGVTSSDVMVSAIYIVGFTIYGVIVLQTAQRPIARPTADEGTLSRSSDPR